MDQSEMICLRRFLSNRPQPFWQLIEVVAIVLRKNLIVHGLGIKRHWVADFGCGSKAMGTATYNAVKGEKTCCNKGWHEETPSPQIQYCEFKVQQKQTGLSLYNRMCVWSISCCGWRLASGRGAVKITKHYLSARLHSVSSGNAYILFLLLGVALSFRTR